MRKILFAFSLKKKKFYFRSRNAVGRNPQAHHNLMASQMVSMDSPQYVQVEVADMADQPFLVYADWCEDRGENSTSSQHILQDSDMEEFILCDGWITPSLLVIYDSGREFFWKIFFFILQHSFQYFFFTTEARLSHA